jgi:hypothetical protein
MNAERYRMQASQLRAKARNEKSRAVRDELEGLAQCYVALAEQHERKGQSEVASKTATSKTAISALG